jgi:error-prone DNA polymerase
MFRSVDDFARRTGLSRAMITRLAKAGTFGSLHVERRDALWESLGQDQKQMPLFDGTAGSGLGKETTENGVHSPAKSESAPFLPPMSSAEEVLADYRTTGLSLRGHPIAFLRPDLAKRGVVTAASLRTLPDGKPVCVAGVVLVRQRPGTAKGITFVTLEDETAAANLIVRPAVWKRYHDAALGATVLLAHGRLQRHGDVIHILTTRLENLSPWMQHLGDQSRNFH